MINELDPDRALLTEGVRAALNSMPQTSQAAKAAVLGVSTYTLQKWLAGHAPSESNLARISRKTGIDTEVIRRGGPENYKEDE